MTEIYSGQPSEPIEMQQSTVDTAVIPAAGLGTRMRPFTSGLPKFMVPIMAGDQAVPGIDFLIDDFRDAGVNNLVFVVSGNGDEVLQNYLGGPGEDVVKWHQALGKDAELEAMMERRKAISAMNIEYIRQVPEDGYGTAVPLSLAKTALRGVDRFIVCGGDDFVWHADGTSETALQIADWRVSGAMFAIAGKPVSRDDAPRYGILQADASSHLVAIDEKPPIERVPNSPLANISRYILGKEIWPYVDGVMQRPLQACQPEYYVTDAINDAATAGLTFQVRAAEGIYIDTGSPKALREAGELMTRELARVHG